MTIKVYPHSGRRSHYRKFRDEGYRELLMSKGWGLKGGYAEKTIRGATIMQTVVGQGEGWTLICFQRKNDFWSEITSRHAENEA